MAMHPDSNFPLRASDQAEVIQIFLQLMREWHGTERAPEVTIRERRRSRHEIDPGCDDPE